MAEDDQHSHRMFVYDQDMEQEVAVRKKNKARLLRDSVISDGLLLQKFRETVHDVFPLATSEVVERIHGVLVTKIYNANSCV